VQAVAAEAEASHSEIRRALAAVNAAQRRRIADTPTATNDSSTTAVTTHSSPATAATAAAAAAHGQHAVSITVDTGQLGFSSSSSRKSIHHSAASTAAAGAVTTGSATTAGADNSSDATSISAAQVPQSPSEKATARRAGKKEELAKRRLEMVTYK
jgi:hypothetical protein